MLVNNIKAELLERFNKVNKLKPNLMMSEVIWLNVQIFIKNDCNSRVTIVSGANSENYGGNRTIYFNRRDIAKDLVGLKIPGKRTDYTGLKAVIRVLRDRCGVPLDPDEFLEVTLPTTGPINIHPTTACMAYMPNSSINLSFAEE